MKLFQINRKEQIPFFALLPDDLDESIINRLNLKVRK